jgi:raffinose/stachyose/melibiose transport system substrate-binding protein
MSHAGVEKPPHPIFNGTNLGVALLIVSFIVSLVLSIRNTLHVERPTKKTIRIAHWQLERGYRDALQAVIDEYEKLHPEVEILQTPVGERFYGQWLNTQLISESGPDLCEMGMTKLAQQEEYTVRYFLPLSGYISAPNPYNADNDLKDVPWRETMVDGMRGGFKEGLQEYYGVPTTLYSMRLFYNKNLLKAATGSDAPPKTFGQWMAQCDKIKAWADKPGNDARTLPLVSCYDIVSLRQKFEPAFTARFEPVMDVDLDGTVTNIESYLAMKSGKITMQTPEVKALLETVRSIGNQMQQDFSSMDRPTAQFYFANGIAGFLWTGSWDASGVYSQAKRRGFEVGICDVPLPARGEPNGDFVLGRANDGVGSGGATFGVAQTSKHTDLALDFLRFLTSRRGNALLSQRSEWPALTIGVEPTKLMAPFIPDPRGFSTRLVLTPGSRTQTDLSGELLNYFQGDTDYATLAAKHQAVINSPTRGGDWTWWYDYDQRRRDVRNKERIMGGEIAKQLIGEPTPEQLDRYNRTLFQQMIRNDALDYPYLFKQSFNRELPEF